MNFDKIDHLYIDAPPGAPTFEERTHISMSTGERLLLVEALKQVCIDAGSEAWKDDHQIANLFRFLTALINVEKL